MRPRIMLIFKNFLNQLAINEVSSNFVTAHCFRGIEKGTQGDPDTCGSSKRIHINIEIHIVSNLHI